MQNLTINYIPAATVATGGLDVEIPGAKDPITVFYINPPYPAVFKQFNVYGSVNITRTILGHPTASFQCTASRPREVELRNTLKNAEFFLWGIKYFVVSLTIERYSLLSKPGNLIDIKVNLTGIHSPKSQPSRSPLDEPVKLSELGNPATVASINKLALASGVRYRGADIKIDVPRETSGGEIVEFRSELESRAVIYGEFVYYSDPNFVTTRPWGRTTKHVLTDAEIVSEKYAINTPGIGTPIADGTVCLVKEYRNTTLNLDRSNIDKYNPNGGDSEGLDEITREEFENTSVEDTIEDVQTAPFIEDLEALESILKDPSSTFDNGGFLKKYRQITERSGIETKRTEQVYGWVFTSKDTYDLIIEDSEVVGTKFREGIAASAQGFWQKIEETTTQHIFDNDGYLIRTLKTGTKKGRVKQESNSLEVMEIEKEIKQSQDDPTASPDTSDETIASRVAEQSLYDYDVDFPIADEQFYELTNFRKVYQDTRIPDIGETDFVEPKFVSKSTRRNLATFSKPDPSSTSDDRKPEVTTKDTFISSARTVIISPNPSNRQLKKPERYKTIEYQQASSGERGKYVAAAGKSSIKKGRPPIHTRLKYGLSVVGVLSFTETPIPPDDLEEGKDFKYYLYTPETPFLPTSSAINPGRVRDFSLSNFSAISGLNKLPLSQNSVSFPGVDSAEVGRKAAQTQISIENTQSAETVTLSILRRPEFSEGDLIIWDNKVWVLLEISEEQIIVPVEGILRIYYRKFQIKLGRLLNVPVELRKYKVPDNSQENSDLSDRLVVVSKD